MSTRSAAIAAIAVAACSAPADDSGRLLGLAPDEAELVVAIAPAQVAGGWLDGVVAGLVRDHVPACVLEAARAAPLVVVAWAADEGALIAIAGAGKGPPCPELVPHGDDRVWTDGLEPGLGRERFFATRERRRRWSEIEAAPVRALADLTLAAGVEVHARATIDPRDGVVARLTVQTDDHATLVSLRDRYLRWRRALDRDRMGAAWPAIAAIMTAADRRDEAQTTDLVELTLRGEDGATAVALAVTALATGVGGVDPRLPCPAILGDFVGRAACDEGEITLTSDLFAELQDEPEVLTSGIRTVDATRNGSFVGVRIEALSALDPLTWLGFANGDIIDQIDGRPLADADWLSPTMARLHAASDVTIGVTRRGRRGTLRFRVH